jgi:Bifunctional DNA primase/polymerase, N-terminal
MNSPGKAFIPTLIDVRSVLERNGKHPVLIPVEASTKKPIHREWQKTTYEQSQSEFHQAALRAHNVGVVLGQRDNLCALDLDTEAAFNALLNINGTLAGTLISRGARGGVFWVYFSGKRPHQTQKLRVKKDSPLAVGASKINDDGTVDIGEFRAEGAQSIICGLHPSGCPYQWLRTGSPVVIDFDSIIWPEDIIIPWQEDELPKQATGELASDGLLKRAIAALSIDKLWTHFGYPERGRRNPVRSPFREDKIPSFSIYDQGRRFRDHGDGSHGDSFNFYQLAKGQTAKEAFVGFVELAGLGTEFAKNKPKQGKKEKIDLFLPSGPVTFTEVAYNVFPVLAKRQRYFVRDRLLVEVAYQKPLKDKQLHDCFHTLEPDAFRSRIEEDFTCWVWRQERSQAVARKGRCTNDAARVLLKTDAAFEHLPAVSSLSAQPVLTSVDGKLKILYRGYHDVHGGIYVCHGNPDNPITMPNLDQARDLILELLRDFLFASASDKSRALAAIIAPALRAGKLLGDADFPIDIAEANDPQSGKTFRLKLNCAVYGIVPYVIANREGGVGSLDESISSALVSGIPFILFENFRGSMNSQLAETCLRGTGKAPARIPHRGEVQLSTTYINWQLSSNGLEATRDFVNRSLITKILKHDNSYNFACYQEGDILAKIKADQPSFLGAVFRIIKEWFDHGCLRTNDARHDFIEFCQALDWIVQNFFSLPPLLDGHTEEVLRVSDPALSWLRLIAIAIHNDNKLGSELSASEILDIGQSHAVPFPGNVFTVNLDQLSMYTGRLLARIFKDSDSVSVDRFLVNRVSRTEFHPQSSRANHNVPFLKHFYSFQLKH